ncbi:MAG: hypothetical protein P8M73_11190 [Luminiphilus sp.]|nr:hypothetical protein [Luminiphilus sp.]
MLWFRSVLILFVSLILVSAPRAQKLVTEEAAMASLEGFFEALSVENYAQGRIDKWVTDDFLIFEMGKAFTWTEFKAFLDGASYGMWISTDWKLSDERVSLTDDSAHISYQNEGEFVYPDPDNPGQRIKERNVWLESAYLVRDQGRLKIKFLQSDNVSQTVESLP